MAPRFPSRWWHARGRQVVLLLLGGTTLAVLVTPTGTAGWGWVGRVLLACAGGGMGWALWRLLAARLAAQARRLAYLEARLVHLEQLAGTDELTGVANRRTFAAHLARELADCPAGAGGVGLDRVCAWA
jgi:hypothetical protein